METKSRVKSSMKNIIYGLSGYAVTLILQLLNRSVFVKMLSAEYLGLNGLFSNILSMLALSELGIGSAMVYALYRPVAEHNTEKIKSLMALYRKLYNVIGTFVLAIGVVITPFLHLFIEEMPDMPLIHVYFLLYVLNSGISYFYTYKRSLIICNQEEYISTTTTMVASVTVRVLQIVILLLTHNYLLFLVVQIVVTRIENIVISNIANKKYPYLKDKNVKKLAKQDTDEIKHNVMAMFAHKIGDVVVNATDNIIVSKILGLISVGMFSNYTMIVTAASGVVDRVFGAITASVGNLVAEDNTEKTERVLKNILFANFWIMSFSSVCMYCLFQTFITVWIGESYLLSTLTMVIIVASFYVRGMRKTVLIFRSAAGLFWKDRYKAIAESIVNVIFSIPLTYAMGIAGVKLGTLLCHLGVAFWLEALVLYKYYFHKSFGPYLVRQLFYAILTCATCMGTDFVCSLVQVAGVGGFLLKIIVCCIVPNVIYVLLFFRTQEFKYFIGLAKKMKKA